MAKDPSLRIKHVLEEIAVLDTLAQKHSAHSFRADPISIRAAAYSLQNISEAVRNLPIDWLAAFPDIPWASIKGFGNVTRHEYFNVDPNIIWETISNQLAPLRQVMLNILDRYRPSQ